MKNILDYIRRQADHNPDREAIVCHRHIPEGKTQLTYAEVYQRMVNRASLPIPLLGDRWNGDFVLHTTGSTGKPKAVTITQQMVMRNSLNLINGHGYNDGLQFIITGPMDHLGCWSKLFPTLMVGGTLHILPDGMKDMDAFFRVMTNRSKHYATFLVPASIRILIQFAADQLRAHADVIEFIETGAAPISRGDMLRLCQLLPHSRLYNTYASTEAGIVATYNYNDGKCKASCCGVPFDNVDFSIDDNGLIAGSSDIGFMDNDGMLHIIGRRDDIINVGGFKVAPAEIEDAAMTIADIQDCICISCQHPIMGQVPELLVVMRSGCSFDKRSIAKAIMPMLDRYKIPQIITETDHIERTFNGKPNRAFYSKVEHSTCQSKM